MKTDTQRKGPCEDEGRNLGYAVINHRIHGVPETGMGKEGRSHRGFGGLIALPKPDFRFEPPELKGINSVIPHHLLCGNLLQQP